MGCGLLGMYHIIYKKRLFVYNMIQNIFLPKVAIISIWVRLHLPASQHHAPDLAFLSISLVTGKRQ
jgi:hypothetical protein